MKINIIIKTLFWLTATILVQVRAEGQPYADFLYSGFDASYGTQTSTLSSNLTLLDGLPVTMRGASAGLLLGSSFWKAKVNVIGSYHSSSETAYAIDLKKSEAIISIYPQSLLRQGKMNKINFYINGGLSREKYKFFGTYLIDEVTGACIVEPATNKLTQWNMTGGAGIDFRLDLQKQFLLFYVEARKSLPMLVSADEDLQNTIQRSVTALQFGVCFGFRH
jgi:hypothetical protein